MNGDCQCPFLQLHKSLPSQYVPLPLLVSLVLLETRFPPEMLFQGGLELSLMHVMQACGLA